MGREYVPVFFDWLDVTQDLTAEEKGNLIDAVVAYASGKEYEHLLSGAVKIAFRFLKGQVDRNAAISDARSKARTNKTEQNETNDNKTEQTETKETNFPKEKEKEKENNKESEKENEPKRKRFTPPTVEEVAAYCMERGNRIDPQRFVDYYTANGWTTGRTKVVDWKACVRTWEGRDKNVPAAQGKTVAAQQYNQRDYGSRQSEAMANFLAMST